MIILFIGGLCLTAGDLIMKKWLVSESWIFCACGIAIWSAGLGCLAAAMKHQNIAIASVILVFCNVGTLAVAEWLFFQGTLSFRQCAGLMLGLAAVLLLETAR